MKTSEIDASLYCSHCHDDTLHHVLILMVNFIVLSVQTASVKLL
jgi:hypothetical protein